MNLFVSFHVDDIERAKAFYSALGLTVNEAMSDHNTSCFVLDDDKFLMISTRAAYAAVGGTEELVGTSGTPSPITLSWAMSSREEVDALLERAEKAGGRIGDTDDYDFMYQRQFDDPEGYHYSPFWMKPETGA